MNTDGSPLKNKIIPTRNAAKKASSSFSSQLDDSPVNSEDEYEKPSRRRRGTGRGRGRERGGGSRRGRAKSAVPTASTSTRIQTQGGAGLESSNAHHSSTSPMSKKKRSFAFSDLSDGDDSPLSSVPTTPVKRSTSFHKASRSKAALTRSLSSVSRLSTSFEMPWSLDGLGNYVWALVSSAGSVFQEEDEKEYIWWPAKKHRLIGHQLTLIPFGNLNPRFNRITIEHPCSENVLSLTDSLGRNRFNEPVFSPPSAVDDLERSPKKKRKTDRDDMRLRWHDALRLMLQAKEEEEDQQDDLPDIAFALSVRSSHASAPVSPSKRKKQTGLSISDTDEAEDLESWEDPGADPELQIPGELVLAREKADSHLSYWPAKVLEYVPPVSRNQKAGKYKVLYLDGAMRIIPRTWFKCLGDEEFGTCKLGEFESTAVNDDPNNNDDDSMMGQPHDREPSPVPSIPPPSSSDFIYLSIREQFCYTKPVLRAVLNEAYHPAMQAHDMFMAGGKARKILNQNAGERGTVTPNDVERLTHFLLSWVLRDEMVARRITDDGVEETLPDDAATPQNTAEVVGGATRDTGTTANGTANGVPYNIDGDRTPIVDHEVDAKASISQTEGEPPTSPSTLPVTVQEGEVPSASSQPASEAPTVRAKSPGTIAEPFVSSPSEEPPPSSLAPSVNDVDMEEPEEDLEGRQTPRLDSSQRTDVEVPSTDVIDQNTSQPIPRTVEEISNAGTAVERNDSSTPANAAIESYEGPPRQIGCERYELLSPLEKIEYCQNVLLPEAILQILLWKEGARTSMELLPDDEEQRLHDQGRELRRRTDWVFDVMYLRNHKVRALERKAGKAKLEKVGGTRTRPLFKMV